MYESIPEFEDNWIECLGHLSCYRMAIESSGEDRGEWANVSSSWYSKAADRTPHVGSLYHHLGMLAEPNMLDQLFYYCKSLCVADPFHPARESILTLFNSTENVAPQGTLVDAAFVQLHGVNFTHIGLEDFSKALSDYLWALDKHIGSQKSGWKVTHEWSAYTPISTLS